MANTTACVVGPRLALAILLTTPYQHRPYKYPRSETICGRPREPRSARINSLCPHSRRDCRAPRSNRGDTCTLSHPVHQPSLACRRAVLRAFASAACTLTLGASVGGCTSAALSSGGATFDAAE